MGDDLVTTGLQPFTFVREFLLHATPHVRFQVQKASRIEDAPTVRFFPDASQRSLLSCIPSAPTVCCGAEQKDIISQRIDYCPQNLSA